MCSATRSIPTRWAFEAKQPRSIANNLVYANTNQGILVAFRRFPITNNTVYQPVGDAIKLQSAPYVRLRNNILWVDAGYDVNVDSPSQVGFDSDYNDLYAALSGKLALWGSREFTTRVDWFYELGQDGHSQTTAPQFINPAGPDGVLGFSAQSASPAQYLDNGQPGFSTSGAWTSQGTGYGSNSLKNDTGGSRQATWTFTGLTPGYYQVAATWPATSYAYFPQYSVYDSNTLLANMDVNQSVAPSDFTDAGVPWKNLGLVYVSDGTLTVILSESRGYVLVADAVRLQAAVGDHGTDDNFHVQPGSPTIDAGDLQSYYLAELMPNGNRVNLGFDGNTAQAATSTASQLVQVLSPNGLEKFEVGQPVNIQWRSAGLTPSGTVALINTGYGGTVDNWLDDTYQTSGYSYTSFTNAVITGAVANPAPQAVYQTYDYSSTNVGDKLAYTLPVPDGTYTIRLHFAEPSYTSVGQRKFDIRLNGAVVQSNYDIYGQAGARYKAVAPSFTVAASGGNGITLELLNQLSGRQAILSGIELTAANAGGVAAPTVNLEVSTDNGGSWSTVATSTSPTVFVSNPGFEAQVLGDGGYIPGNLTGWTITGGTDAGPFNPAANMYAGGLVPEGQNGAYSNGPTLSQVLPATLKPSTDYTLQVDVGQRLDAGIAGYGVELLAGGTILAQASSPIPATGAFVTATVTYHAAADDFLLGQPLEIRLLSGGLQANFDNVALKRRASRANR